MLIDGRGKEVETVHVEIDEVTHVTGKALIVVLSESGRKMSVPISLIDIDDCDITDVGDSGTLTVAKWFADQEGMKDAD